MSGRVRHDFGIYYVLSETHYAVHELRVKPVHVAIVFALARNDSFLVVVK